MGKKILCLNGITKKYPGVIALQNVSLSFDEGEVHAIAGENGAGKSTFIKIITGAIQATSGCTLLSHARSALPSFAEICKAM